MRLGGTVENTLKGGGTEIRGGETKILKREGKLGQGVGALKKGEGWNPLTNYGGREMENWVKMSKTYSYSFQMFARVT